jgi:hypothetical protein
MVETRLTGRIFLAAATLAGTALVPALANAEPATGVNGSALNLSVHAETRGEPPRSALLTCHPSGGSHPNADAACQALGEVNGDFNLLGGGHSICTQNYAPVKVAARGNWQGRPVNFEKTYSNSCIAESETGKVFVF